MQREYWRPGPAGRGWRLVAVSIFGIVLILLAAVTAGPAARAGEAGASTSVEPLFTDSEAYRAFLILSQAGIIPGEESSARRAGEALTRGEAALWLARLLQWLEERGGWSLDEHGSLVLAPATQAALRQLVAEEVAREVAAALAAGQAPAPRERVIERQVVVETAKPGPLLEQAEAAVKRAQEALEAAARAQEEATRAYEQAAQATATAGELSSRLQMVGEELGAARQALAALEARLQALSGLDATVEQLSEQLSSLRAQLDDLAAALAGTDQRVTAVDLRVAAGQGDIETLRLLIDEKAAELAAGWGMDRQKFTDALNEARERVATLEKDAVRKEALAAVQALVESRTTQLQEALAELAGEFRPELARLAEQIGAVEEQVAAVAGRVSAVEERVGALSGEVAEQRKRLEQLELRPPLLQPEFRWEWVSRSVHGSDQEAAGEAALRGLPAGDFVRYGLRLDFEDWQAGHKGTMAAVIEPATSRLWQRATIERSWSGGSTSLGVYLLPAGERPPEGENMLVPMAARWSAAFTLRSSGLPELYGEWGTWFVGGKPWWRGALRIPEARWPAVPGVRLAASIWAGDGLETWAGDGLETWASDDGRFPPLGWAELGLQAGYRLQASVGTGDSAILEIGWEQGWLTGATGREAGRSGWVLWQLPIATVGVLRLGGKQTWFSREAGATGEWQMTELYASAGLGF